jgi:hypothetical protein
MRDGCAIRRFAFCAFYVLMNPLVIAGGFGKLVDAFLRNFEPVADSDFLSKQGTGFVNGLKFSNGHVVTPASSVDWKASAILAAG